VAEIVHRRKLKIKYLLYKESLILKAINIIYCIQMQYLIKRQKMEEIWK